MTNRIVRWNGFITREQDVINLSVARGSTTEIATRIAARAPTWEGFPLSYDQLDRAMRNMDRNGNIGAMASEPDNGDRFW